MGGVIMIKQPKGKEAATQFVEAPAFRFSVVYDADKHPYVGAWRAAMKYLQEKALAQGGEGFFIPLEDGCLPSYIPGIGKFGIGSSRELLRGSSYFALFGYSEDGREFADLAGEERERKREAAFLQYILNFLQKKGISNEKRDENGKITHITLLQLSAICSVLQGFRDQDDRLANPLHSLPGLVYDVAAEGIGGAGCFLRPGAVSQVMSVDKINDGWSYSFTGGVDMFCPATNGVCALINVSAAMNFRESDGALASVVVQYTFPEEVEVSVAKTDQQGRHLENKQSTLKFTDIVVTSLLEQGAFSFVNSIDGMLSSLSLEQFMQYLPRILQYLSLEQLMQYFPRILQYLSLEQLMQYFPKISQYLSLEQLVQYLPQVLGRLAALNLGENEKFRKYAQQAVEVVMVSKSKMVSEEAVFGMFASLHTASRKHRLTSPQILGAILGAAALDMNNVLLNFLRDYDLMTTLVNDNKNNIVTLFSIIASNYLKFRTLQVSSSNKASTSSNSQIIDKNLMVLEQCLERFFSKGWFNLGFPHGVNFRKRIDGNRDLREAIARILKGMGKEQIGMIGPLMPKSIWRYVVRKQEGDAKGLNRAAAVAALTLAPDLGQLPERSMSAPPRTTRLTQTRPAATGKSTKRPAPAFVQPPQPQPQPPAEVDAIGAY